MITQRSYDTTSAVYDNNLLSYNKSKTHFSRCVPPFSHPSCWYRGAICCCMYFCRYMKVIYQLTLCGADTKHEWTSKLDGLSGLYLKTLLRCPFDKTLAWLCNFDSCVASIREFWLSGLPHTTLSCLLHYVYSKIATVLSLYFALVCKRPYLQRTVSTGFGEHIVKIT